MKRNYIPCLSNIMLLQIFHCCGHRPEYYDIQVLYSSFDYLSTEGRFFEDVLSAERIIFHELYNTTCISGTLLGTEVP